MTQQKYFDKCTTQQHTLKHMYNIKLLNIFLNNWIVKKQKSHYNVYNGDNTSALEKEIHLLQILKQCQRVLYFYQRFYNRVNSSKLEAKNPELLCASLYFPLYI
jgi:hypothetical protein